MSQPMLWWGSYAGGWKAERMVFDGGVEPGFCTVTVNDIVDRT